jgi:ATP-dependent Clp protease ATP-binding subunit ClpC
VFHKLEQEDIRKIIDLMINKVTELMKKQGIEIEVTDSAKDLVAKQGFDQNYGARPLRRAIQSMIEDKVAEAILDGKVKDKAIVDCNEDKIVVRY